MSERTFNSAAYWEERYATGGNSGNGSYGEHAAYKADFLNKFVAEYGVKTVLELGCGDGNQLALAKYPFYLGVDTSPTAIEMCREKFAGDEQKRFALQGEFTFYPDLALSLDVIYHLVEDDVYEAYMRELFGWPRTWVIIYANDVEGEARHHVRWRMFTHWIHFNAPEWQHYNYVKAPPGDYQDFHIFLKS